MANTKSAAKRARQSTTRHDRNVSVLSALKSGQKKLRTALAKGDTETAKVEFQKVSSALDKAAKRGVIHKNSADRRKAVFNRALASKQA
jgi:small subunit ribosomal protein S20